MGPFRVVSTQPKGAPNLRYATAIQKETRLVQWNRGLVQSTVQNPVQSRRKRCRGKESSPSTLHQENAPDPVALLAEDPTYAVTAAAIRPELLGRSTLRSGSPGSSITCSSRRQQSSFKSHDPLYVRVDDLSFDAGATASPTTPRVGRRMGWSFDSARTRRLIRTIVGPKPLANQTLAALKVDLAEGRVRAAPSVDSLNATSSSIGTWDSAARFES